MGKTLIADDVATIYSEGRIRKVQRWKCWNRDEDERIGLCNLKIYKFI